MSIFNNSTNIIKKIDFASTHIGGKNNDDTNTFENQTNLIANSTNDSARLVDFYDNMERDKNKNNNYVERLDNKLNTTVYRLNNYASFVDDVNYSNPVIYPNEYDEYFEYLNNKNLNPINTQVVKTKNYINIDSSNRNTQTFLNIEKYTSIPNYSLEFTNNSNLFKIYLNNSVENIKQNDYIILRGYQNYRIGYTNLNFFFTNGSNLVILDLKPNYAIPIPYYDIVITISGVKSNDENSLDYWKNIPLKLINQTHKVTAEYKDNDYRMCIELPINFYSQNDSNITLISDCVIIYSNVGNYPINLINSNTPITTTNLNDYLIVSDSTNNYIELMLNSTISINNNINIDGYWNGDKFYTGTNIQIGKIINSVKGYYNPNSYSINLDKTYNNICSIKMKSSEIPNVQKNIYTSTESIRSFNSKKTLQNLTYLNNSNNKLYWENIIDYGIYKIELEPGYYSYDKLKTTIEHKVSIIPRNLIFSNLNIYKYNSMEVNFYPETNISTFKLSNINILPNCLKSLETIISESNNILYNITIFHPSHNLKIGDKIYISNSIDFYTISKNIINSIDGHIITNIINENNYVITINNINLISDSGDTSGGQEINIKSPAIFRLFFNFPDTFGSLIGFNLVGEQTSITNYSSAAKSYTISNVDSYYININKTLIINDNLNVNDVITDFNKENIRYILLQIENLNVHSNPGGPQFFYKILLNSLPNTYLYNTFVDTPVYFNPPLKSLNKLDITFITPSGNLVSFGNLEHSFTLEITSFNNFPENTNINVSMSRI